MILKGNTVPLLSKCNVNLGSSLSPISYVSRSSPSVYWMKNNQSVFPLAFPYDHAAGSSNICSALWSHCASLPLRCSGEQYASSHMCSQSSQKQPPKQGTTLPFLPLHLVGFAVYSFQLTKSAQSVRTETFLLGRKWTQHWLYKDLQ